MLCLCDFFGPHVINDLLTAAIHIIPTSPLQGCLKLQNDISKLMIMLCKQEDIPLEKCIAMLWSGRRLNHSLCSSPISENFILDISKYSVVNVDSFDYWINCIKGHPASLCMFLQKLSLTNSVFPEVSGCTLERSFGSQITVDEVKKVASSLIADVSFCGYNMATICARFF